MDFSEALKRIKEGKKAARRGWNGKGMYIFLIEDGKFNQDSVAACLGAYDMEPFICMFTANKDFVPWLASQTDLMAKDWDVAE